jgi:hypothetical protein
MKLSQSDDGFNDTITAYMFTPGPGDYSISVSRTPDHVHLWFGFYPGGD